MPRPVDGKRWLQPLNVAGISVVVGRRSRVSGEGGTEEGVWSGSALRFEPADECRGLFLLLFAVLSRVPLKIRASLSGRVS